MIANNKVKDCSYFYDCCDCGGVGCECPGCWSCNACQNCLDDNREYCDFVEEGLHIEEMPVENRKLYEMSFDFIEEIKAKPVSYDKWVQDFYLLLVAFLLGIVFCYAVIKLY